MAISTNQKSEELLVMLRAFNAAYSHVSSKSVDPLSSPTVNHSGLVSVASKMLALGVPAGASPEFKLSLIALRDELYKVGG